MKYRSLRTILTLTPHFPAFLLPQIDRLAFAPYPFRAALHEALEIRLVAIRAARDVVERRCEMERPQISVGAKDFVAAPIEEHQRRRICDPQLARPVAFQHPLARRRDDRAPAEE